MTLTPHLRMTAAALAAAFLLTGAVSSARSAEESDWSFDAELALQGKYVFRGALLFDGPVLQPGVKLGWRGLVVGVWASMELDNTDGNSGEFTEVDYTVEYSRSFGDLSLTAGFAHYRFPSTPYEPTSEVYATASLDWPVSPSLSVYRDVDRSDGLYAALSLSWSAEDIWEPLPGARASVELSASVGWTSERGNRDAFGYEHDALTDATVVLAAPVRLGEYWTLTPSVSCSTLLDHGLRACAKDDDNLWAGLTLSFSF